MYGTCKFLTHKLLLFIVMQMKLENLLELKIVSGFTEKFCKWILKDKVNTNNNTLYGETGRFTLYILKGIYELLSTGLKLQ